MIFSYRTTLVDAVNMRAKNVNYNIDTDQWLDVMRADERGLYGNSVELVEREVLSLLEAESFGARKPAAAPGRPVAQAQQRHHLPALHVRMGRLQAGEVLADVWAVMLGTAWQSGSRGMMAAVKLPAGAGHRDV